MYKTLYSIITFAGKYFIPIETNKNSNIDNKNYSNNFRYILSFTI